MLLSIIGKLNAGEFRDVQCASPQKGRFVSIYFGHSGTLTVCELEVYGCKYLSSLSVNGVLDFEIKLWLISIHINLYFVLHHLKYVCISLIRM